MTQAERRLFLIQALKDEQAEYRDLRVPRDAMGQRKLLRSLLNVRAPGAVGDDFLAVQDDYLQQELAEDGVTRAEDLSPVSGDLCLWQGDITRRQLRPDGLLPPLPRLHRQLHPHLRGHPAPAGLRRPHGGPGPRRACGPGQDHAGL